MTEALRCPGLAVVVPNGKELQQGACQTHRAEGSCGALGGLKLGSWGAGGSGEWGGAVPHPSCKWLSRPCLVLNEAGPHAPHRTAGWQPWRFCVLVLCCRMSSHDA